jgi:hypothetical protein
MLCRSGPGKDVDGLALGISGYADPKDLNISSSLTPRLENPTNSGSMGDGWDDKKLLCSLS